MDSKKRKLEENGGLEITEEDVLKLIEPFAKEQLLTILQQAAVLHPDVLEQIRKLADKDPVHRKLFVRGLGWDTTAESLKGVFSQYGELEGSTVIVDKSTGKSKGYGFVTFKHMDGAQRALKEPSKKIDGRISVCQLASAGPAHQQSANNQAARKIYVGNVPFDLPADKLLNIFSEYGEIEEGPLGFDKQTGRSKGFALFIYKTVEAAKRALEEPMKDMDGHQLICKLAGENQKQKASQGVLEGVDLALMQAGGATSNLAFGALNPSSLAGGIPLNQGLNLAINPGLSHSLNPVLAAQGLHSALNPNQSLAGLNASFNPSLAQQLGFNSPLSSSLTSSLNPSLNSSLNASLTQGASQSLAQALGQVPTSVGYATYGLHGLGSYASQVQQALGGPQSTHAGILGASLYGVPTSSVASQTALLQAAGSRHPLASLQSSQLTQASGARAKSLSSYYTN